MEALIESLAWLVNWFNEGVYQFAVETFSEMIQWLVLLKIKTMIFTLQFSWDIAKDILVDLKLSEGIQQALGGLNDDVRGMIDFFKIPDALDLILRAGVTKFVLRFLGA